MNLYHEGGESRLFLLKDVDYTMNIIETPLSEQEVLALKDEKDFIRGVVPVSLQSIIDTDQIGFEDILSTSFVGRSALTDIDYTVVGHQDEYTLLVEVVANASFFLRQEQSFDL